MYLKTLTLKGFKSFAETTVLDLEPGITVVVGPNGSGKSNVVDAVAWVLGAQGPSALRSAKMEDVIFAGSGRRPALGRAEVSLTIDNADGSLPIGLAEVTVTRTLWRSGESEYAINGSPCRLLDISELLSDSGVGRSQHVIVSQGQLDGVLSGRPEDRRLMIEEAAGILKFRRRRERTERRIAATAGDLARLEDLVGEVRAQLRPLQRQADAAERHDGLVAESRAIRLHLAGRELKAAQTVVATTEAACQDVEARLIELRERLGSLDDAMRSEEAALSAESADENDTLIGALDRLGERAKGLAALVGERRRSLSRSLESMVDESLVASLASEAAALRVSLHQAEVEETLLREEQGLLEADAAELEADGEDAEGRWALEDAELLASSIGHGEATRDYLKIDPGELRGRCGAMSAALARDNAELTRNQGVLRIAQARVSELTVTLESKRRALTDLEQASPELARALAEAEAEKDEADGRAVVAASVARDAESESHTWQARADALAMALHQLRARGGAGNLAGSPGLLGTLAELVAVDHGWEAAFEAAVGDAIASVVFEDGLRAADAVERLSTEGTSGLVICRSAVAGTDDTVLRRPPHLVPGQGELLAHVRASSSVVGAIIERLLGPVVSVEGGWRPALELALAHPETVFVTREGDRLGPGGWRVGDPGLGATGAALDEARNRAATAVELVAGAQATLASVASELSEAGQSAARLALERDASASQLARATGELAQAESDLGRAALEAATIGDAVALLLGRVQEDSVELAGLEGLLATAELEEAAVAMRQRERSQTRGRLEARAADLGARRQSFEVRSAGMDERTSMLSARLAEIEQRLARTVAAREGEAGRRQSLERAELVTVRLVGVVRAAQERLDSELVALRQDQARRTARRDERLAELRRLRVERARLDAGTVEAQRVVHDADLARAEAGFRCQAAVEALRLGLGVDPEIALSASCPELPPGVTPEQRAQDLERKLRLAGPVNPLAFAELEVVKQRSTLLDAQLADVRAARAELSKLLSAIDAEMAGVFAAAYEDVARHFSHLFGTLFAGGEGTLCLTDPDNLLETGVEVMARPAGKRVRSISLLSGGERSLVALAFLFAIFRSRPSPFYLLDEVEAALDDVNLQRFLDLINEFRSDAQLIIVSHQRRTMEVADWLYGVSMASGASSRVVSERTTSLS